jgi:predicted metal-dependent hydrolase
MRIGKVVEPTVLNLGDYHVELIRKPIRSIRLTISNEGKIRLSAPLNFSTKEATAFILQRMEWINKHMERVHREKELEPADFSQLLFLNNQLQTCLNFQSNRSQITFIEPDKLRICLKSGQTEASIPFLLNKWYGEQLKQLIDPMIKQWEPRMNVSVNKIKYRFMKTRWGSCQIKTHDITFNTDLAKKSLSCIEYIVVHEMAHLLERGHGPAFKAVMDRYLPDWHQRQKNLKNTR